MTPRFYLRPEDRRPAAGIAAMAVGPPLLIIVAGDHWVVAFLAALLWLVLCVAYALSGPRRWTGGRR